MTWYGGSVSFEVKRRVIDERLIELELERALGNRGYTFYGSSLHSIHSSGLSKKDGEHMRYSMYRWRSGGMGTEDTLDGWRLSVESTGDVHSQALLEIAKGIVEKFEGTLYPKSNCDMHSLEGIAANAIGQGVQ